MPRPRYQVNIGTLMVATVIVALGALAIRFGYMMLWTPVTLYGPKVLAVAHVRARCRADGRKWSKLDQDAAWRLGYWIAAGEILILGVIALIVMRLR